MELANIAIYVAGFAILLTILWPLYQNAKSVDLIQNFKKIGDFNNKSLTEISKIVGEPSTIESVSDGEVVTWSSKKYVIILKFDSNNVFHSKVSEVSTK